MDTEERLAVFLDYENLALGAREHLGGMQFDFQPIADALAVRGRVVTRRAYADWSYFDEDRRMLTRHQVELIEMPQRMGASRKNAADIKMVVDAIEMAFEREYISTFVMCTGDSDFSPLVHKLRELDKRVIGVGVEKSTSRLLPSACDEFLFYDRLEGVEVPDESEAPQKKSPARRSGSGRSSSARSTTGRAKAGAVAEELPPAEEATPTATSATASGTTSGGRTRRKKPEITLPEPVDVPDRAPEPANDEDDDAPTGEPPTMEVKVAQTLAGLQGSASGSVTASQLKRTLVRKEPTFSESDYGFRTFGEFLRYLADRDVIVLSDGPSSGDPVVELPEQPDSAKAFDLLRAVVQEAGGTAALSGLKNHVRKRRPDFSEKALGYGGFLQFCKAAAAADAVRLAWDDDAEDYLVSLG
ncbi:NYN domain-containing protein [Isoptericola sp. S6320L]|uniref:NYN domain-containing protein n=1 Tax=Isoptericola sp. S6320L TaxID=2926411 RepID=UPI001FF2BF18|nr:NYN domain-containing protein [Isoptericola sp. S6320L]MCK0116109.1 NYN domain-containing protein [Isoptericola sp. S6320L]